jgi:ribosomal protein S8
VFPNIRYNTYSHLINHVNLITTKKIPKTHICLTRKNLALIKCLHSIGCVGKFLITKHLNKAHNWTSVYISVPYYKSTPFFKSVRIVSTPSKQHRTSISGLKLISNSLKSSTIILSTSMGIITHREALRSNIGGLILCIVH